nr:transposase (putative), gypsy type [Tanacetum cinerariifolium]
MFEIDQSRDHGYIFGDLLTLSEYLLEFTSEYDILEDLHPELPGPEERIVDFSEGKVGMYTKFFEFANFCIPISQFLFDILGHYQIYSSQLSVIGAAKVDERVFPTIVDWHTNALKDEMPAANTYSRADVAVLHTRRTPIQKQSETLLCLVGLSQRYCLGDDIYPTFLYDDDRDMDLFNLISAPNPTKVKTGLRLRVAHEVPLLTATTSRVIDMKHLDAATESSGTPSTIEKSPLDFDNENPSQQITEGKGTEDQAHKIVAPKIPPPVNMSATGATPEVGLKEEVAAMGPLLSKKHRKRVNDGADMNAPPKGVIDPDPLSYAKPQPYPEQNMALAFEIPTRNMATMEVQDLYSAESIGSWKSTSSPSMVGSPKGIYQPGWGVTNSCRLDTPDACHDVVDHIVPPWVEKRCAKIDACLDALSIDFDEELYPHMLTAIAGRRWVIRHGMRLAVMKCDESIELRHAFVNVVFAGIAKGMSEGLVHGIKHGKAGRDLEDAPMEVIMASLHLESDSGEDAPKWIRDLRPSTSQLKIHVYLEVRDPRDPYAVKGEMLLEDAITANVSRSEKKKRCQVVCRTLRVGFIHHARYDGVPISVPTIAPQGLAILLADAATQTETSEDDASPRLLRSKSLPPMYNLDFHSTACGT